MDDVVVRKRDLHTNPRRNLALAVFLAFAGAFEGVSGKDSVISACHSG